MSQIDHVQLEQLIERCVAETRRFRDVQESDPAFCYELFRRALASSDISAFNELYKLYKPQLENWAKSHPLTSKVNLSPEICASESLIRMWEYLSGEKFFEKTPTFPQILVYLRRTLNTVILEEYRRQRRRVVEVELLDTIPDEGTKKLQLADADVLNLLHRISKLIPARDDQLIIMCKLYYGMGIAEIMESYPGRWNRPEDISKRLYVLRKLLQNDPQIREWAGLTEQDRASE